MDNNQQQQSSFWQFSDQLRIQNSNLANLSLNDSIWSTNYPSRRPDERRNFDVRLGSDVNSVKPKPPPDFNQFNDAWKLGSSGNVGFGPIGGPVSPSPAAQKNFPQLNGGFNKGVYQNSNFKLPINSSFSLNNIKGGSKNKSHDDEIYPGGKKKNSGKKNNSYNSAFNGDGGENKDGKSGGDKRFKTLPPAESLPRNETVGGYIFVCNNDTMAENLKRQLFGTFL